MPAHHPKSLTLLALAAFLAGCGDATPPTASAPSAKAAADVVELPMSSAPPPAAASAPAASTQAARQYAATIETTKGKIVLTLFAKDAPKTVDNFVTLARKGFYNGTIFHRVIPGFMIQGGDPTGTGRGGPGYQFENENQSSAHGFGPGTVAMANAGPDTNGSQFFICEGPNAGHLPASGYTIFGEVKEGQDVVSAIAHVPTGANDRPVEDVAMTKVTIEEK